MIGVIGVIGVPTVVVVIGGGGDRVILFCHFLRNFAHGRRFS